MPSSAWDDYFEALEEYLESVRIAIAVGRVATVPARLVSRPSGSLPPGYDSRQKAAVQALETLIATAEAQRDDVADRLRSIRRRDRPANRARLIDCEL